MQNPVKKIPLLNIPDKPLVGTTQNHIPIAEIENGIVLFKDAGAAIVLETTSLNFGLLSEREQEAVVAAFAALINSLSFPIQILVRTEKKDVSKYIKSIEEHIPNVKSEKLKGLMIGYKNFISETIKKKNVLGKRFFIVIPFSPFELGLNAKSLLDFKKKKRAIPYSKEYVIKKIQTSLYPKRDHLIRQATRLGLKMRQLSDEEIIKLYYNIYNPDFEAIQVKEKEEEIKNESI